MITVAGIVVGIYLARYAGQRERWLRAVILAQAADLVTFAAIWENGQLLGERNPLAGLAMSAFLGLMGPAVRDIGDGPAVMAASALLMGLKVGLIWYVQRIEPILGRYRRPVLAVALAAGAVGAVSNVVGYGNTATSLAVVAVFAIVAIRWPARFGAAMRVGIGLSGAGLLGIGGLAATSYLEFVERYLADPEVCAVTVCSPDLATQLQVAASLCFVLAAVALALTIRYVVRVVPPRRSHAA